MVEVQRQYQAMFENMAQGVFFQRDDRSLVDVNPAALAMLGLTRAQFEARTVFDPDWQVINEDGSPLAADQFPSSLALQSGQPVRDFVLGVFNPQQNRFVWMTVNAVPLFEEGCRQPFQVLVTMNDISERKRMDDIHASRLHLMEYASSHTLDELLVETLDVLEKITDSVIGFYHFYDDDLRCVTLKVWSTDTSNKFCHVEGVQEHYSVDQSGVWVDAVRARGPVVHNDYAALANRRGLLSEGHAPVIRELVVPVLRQNRIVAILGVGNKPQDYTETDIDTVRLFADLAWEIAERKQYEQQQQQAIRKYEVLISTSMDGFWMVDFSGRILFANETLCRLYGYCRDEILTKSLRDFEAIENNVQLQAHHQKIISEGYDRFETRHRTKQGEEIEVEVSTAYIAADKIFLAFVRDVSERKRAENALRQSEQRFRSLFESSPDAVFLTILDGRVSACNSAACEMLGYSEAEICRLGRSGIMDETDLRLTEGMKNRQSIGKVQALELTAVRKNGEKFAVEIDSAIIDQEAQQSFVIMRDISKRIEAENALRASEQKYRQLFFNQPSGFALHEIVLDANGEPCDYRFLEINPAFEKLTGLQAQDLIGKTVLEVMPQTESYWIETYGGVALTGKPISFENFSVEIDKYYQVNAYSPEKGKFATIFYDITDHKLAELELKKIQNLYAEAEKTGKVGGWEVNLSSDKLKWTEEVYRIHEVDGDFQPTIENGINFYTPSSRPIVEQAIQRALEFGEAFDLELEILTAKGHLKSVHVIGKADPKQQKVVGFFQDITARKNAEQQTDDLSQRLLLATSAAHLGVWDWNLRDNSMVWDDRMFELYGISRERSLNTIDVWINVLHPEDKEAAIAECQAALNGEREFDTEFRVRHPDGTVKHLKASGLVILGADGQAERMIGINADITESKRAEEEKAKLENQLHQAQKIESIGQLAGGVAHDFNNMLGVIMGHAELAMMKSDPSSPFLQELEEIREAAKRSADLTRQLLTFARKQAITPKILDLNDTVAGMLKMLQRLIGENIQLSWSPAANLWPVKVDPSQIDQILANLCVNARDAISGIGNISIETENCRFNENYQQSHPDVLPGDYVRLSVGDNGSGMDEDTLAHIFEPFFTTKEVGSGTGLGLATVFGAVKQNNGFVDVVSQPGQGTTFHIYLPRMRAIENRTHETVTKSVLSGTETILLVEDDKMLLRMTRSMLEKSGYRVLAANTPDQAQSLAREHPDPIHLLISDVIMPAMNGKDLSDLLRVLRPEMKVIFMSGYSRDVISSRGEIEAGLNFLQKPVSYEVLMAKVREVLDVG